MNPAASVIIFTVFSGVGLGQLFWLGILPPQGNELEIFTQFAFALTLTVTGLLSSTLHLASPSRAWRAFSQWRTSWLSREGCLSIFTLIATAIYAILILFFAKVSEVLGFVVAISALATVYTTSMIYAQLKTVPRWNHWTTCPLFLLLSLTGGAIVILPPDMLLLLFCGAAIFQIVTWKTTKTAFKNNLTTMQTATGLQNMKKINLFEAPHTGTNYLCKEMVYTVGRKHVQKLQIIALMLMFVLPVLLLILLPAIVGVSLIILLLHMVGTIVSRWLFFAQAEHVVGLYYGKHTDNA